MDQLLSLKFVPLKAHSSVARNRFLFCIYTYEAHKKGSHETLSDWPQILFDPSKCGDLYQLLFLHGRDNGLRSLRNEEAQQQRMQFPFS